MKTSVILTSRDDNYGGNLHKRSSMSITSLIENHDEVVFVDWKTKNGEGLISKIKNNIPHTKKLKWVQVPKDFLISKYPHLAYYSMIESIGRNVGIRRTENDYIISTNIDIVTTPIDLTRIDQNYFYTVPRRDVGESHHLSFETYEDLYENLNSNRDSFSPKERINTSSDEWSLINCCGDFQIGHRDIWFKMKGFEESILFGCGIDTNVMKKASYHSQIDVLDHYIFHLNHGKSAIRDEDEQLPPMSDQNSVIKNFTDTTNPDNWGMSDEDLPTEII